jgi:formyl-CoA transferase
LTDPLPLEGIRVLALENFIAGPVASMWLADAGAEVVKIERPHVGEQSRGLSPSRGSGDEARSLSFLRANRNKRSVALDIKSLAGREVLQRLLAHTDILVENLNPTALSRLGLDYASLRDRFPRLVYVSVSGYGRGLRPSPEAGAPAFDVIGQAASGLMWRPQGAGDTPRYLGFPLTDVFASTIAVAGTYQALFARERTGRGAHVDVSLVDGGAALNELSIIMRSALGVRPAPGLHALTAPFGAFEAKDGWLVIGVLGDAVWRRFVAVIDAPEMLADPRLRDGTTRHANLPVIMEHLGPWLAARTVEQAVGELGAGDVPAAPVLDVDDLLKSAHLRARGMLVEVDDPAWGRVTMAGNPLKTSLVPHDLARPAPGLGADTDDVLTGWAGVAPDELTALRSTGVIG